MALVLTVVGASAPAATLEDAVGMALSTNPQVVGRAATVRAASHDLRRARAGYFPAVDLDTGYGIEHSNIKQLSQSNGDDTLWRREAGLSVRQMLWDGLFTKYEVERRVALLNSAEFSLSDTRESLAFRAVQAYLDVLRGQELVALAQENVSHHQTTLNNVAAKEDSGVGNRADVAQATARLALAESTLIARVGDLKEAAATYERVIGEAPVDLVAPARKATGWLAENEMNAASVDGAIDAAQAQASSDHPAILKSQADVAAAAAEIQTARAAYQPRLDLEGALRRDDNVAGVEGVRNTDALMLVARWNLFRGGADRAQEQAAVERRSVADEEAADVQRLIAENVAIAYQARAASEGRIAPLQQHVDSTTGTLQAYRAQFELGKRTLLDVLNAENELFNAKSSLTSGIYEDLINQYFVEASKAQLVNSLGISPSAP